jgi:hypothetical protein
MITNVDIYFTIAAEAQAEAERLENVARRPNPDGGFIITYDPERNSFKNSLIAITFAGIYLEAPQDDSSDKQRYAFWRHVDIATVIQQGKRSYREHFLDRQSLKNLADLYLAGPWMHSAYLDWIFTDALIAGELVATYEWLQVQRGGFAYALFEGNKVKTVIFKMVQVPLSVVLGWVAPGLLCWWLYPSFPRMSIIIAVAYYVIGVGWFSFQLCRRALYRLRGGKSLRQRAAELNASMFSAYYELREATIHVPSLRRAVEQAKEKGVGWDPQLFCVLDNVAQKHPSTWTVQYR